MTSRSALPRPEDAADPDVGELAPDEPERQDEQDDRGEVRRQERLPRHDDHRRRDRARGPVWVRVANGRTSQARSRPRSDPATSPTTSRKTLSIDSHSASWPVDRPSARSRANSPIRSLVEIVELTRKPIAGEQHRRERAEAEDPDQPERHGIRRQLAGQLLPPDDAGGPGRRLAERGERPRARSPGCDGQPPLVGLLGPAGRE